MKDKLVFGVLISAVLLGVAGGSLVNRFESPIVMDTAQRYAQVLRLGDLANVRPNPIGATPQPMARPITTSP